MKTKLIYESLPALPLAAQILCLCSVSCSQAETAGMRGEPLPPGKYPIELVSVGLQGVVPTRGTVDNDWDGTGTVAVQVGSEVRPYTVMSAAGGTSATLYSDTPFCWENTSDTKTVTAWYPYSTSYPEDWTVKADQSTAANYQASDLIKGELKDLSFDDRDNPAKNKMTFRHQTAKVVVNLVAGEGISLDDSFSVKLLNVSGVEGESPVTPYVPAGNAHTYISLLNGQVIKAKTPFIQVEAGGDTFIYKPSAATSLDAGMSYTYTITVQAGGLDVRYAACSMWTENGDSEIVKSATAIYAAGDLKFGDYYYSDGTTSDGGLRKLYSDGTMGIENPKPAPVSGRTVAGIVFYVGQHPGDKSDYTSSGIGQKNCRGYAVALQDATAGFCKWSIADKNLGCCPVDDKGTGLNNFSDPDVDWNGYLWTQTITADAGGENGLMSGYPGAYYAVVAYRNKTAAPAGSSGWFLPAIGQLRTVHLLQDELFDFVDGAGKFNPDGYWSSSEYNASPDTQVLRVREIYGSVRHWYKTDAGCNVRAVLAF